MTISSVIKDIDNFISKQEKPEGNPYGGADFYKDRAQYDAVKRYKFGTSDHARGKKCKVCGKDWSEHLVGVEGGSNGGAACPGHEKEKFVAPTTAKQPEVPAAAKVEPIFRKPVHGETRYRYYLKSGEQAPPGRQVFRGPRGGEYFLATEGEIGQHRGRPHKESAELRARAKMGAGVEAPKAEEQLEYPMHDEKQHWPESSGDRDVFVNAARYKFGHDIIDDGGHNPNNKGQKCKLCGETWGAHKGASCPSDAKRISGVATEEVVEKPAEKKKVETAPVKDLESEIKSLDDRLSEARLHLTDYGISSKELETIKIDTDAIKQKYLDEHKSIIEKYDNQIRRLESIKAKIVLLQNSGGGSVALPNALGEIAAKVDRRQRHIDEVKEAAAKEVEKVELPKGAIFKRFQSIFEDVLTKDKEFATADVKASSKENGGCNGNNKVTLTNGEKGYFKPAASEHSDLPRMYGIDKSTQWKREILAYKMCHSILGWDYVPPTVPYYNKYKTSSGASGEGVGSLQKKCPGKDARDDYQNSPKYHLSDARDNIEDIAFMDYIFGSMDRNPGNFLWDKNKKKYWAIDHGLTFPAKNYDHCNRFIEAVQGDKIKPRHIVKLNMLEKKKSEANALMSKYINADEISTFWKRVDNMLVKKKFLDVTDSGGGPRKD